LYVVQYTAPAGACAIEARFIFPIGEHPQESYSVSVCDTVVESWPASSLITRPKPSSDFLVQCPFVVEVVVPAVVR
jgi:hypothetical protein